MSFTTSLGALFANPPETAVRLTPRGQKLARKLAAMPSRQRLRWITRYLRRASALLREEL